MSPVVRFKLFYENFKQNFLSIDANFMAIMLFFRFLEFSHVCKKHTKKQPFAQGYEIVTLSHIDRRGLQNRYERKNFHSLFLYRFRSYFDPHDPLDRYVSCPKSQNNRLYRRRNCQKMTQILITVNKKVAILKDGQVSMNGFVYGVCGCVCVFLSVGHLLEVCGCLSLKPRFSEK